jgi:uncharacterized protein YdiU (UPF0061 family)
MGTVDDLRKLADYTLERHFPDIEKGDRKYLSMLEEVIKRQAKLISQWQLVGFIHGVMNTDNMTISGETIDYGPCAFMDVYDPATVFSSIDTGGRYAYGNQPYMGGWNLARFAESLLPLLHENQEKAIEIAQEAISNFSNLYESSWFTGMGAKLGLFKEEEQDKPLIEELLQLMEKHQADFTNTFRALTFDSAENTDLFKSKEFVEWKKLWKKRLTKQKESKEESHQLMRTNNPSVIPRNHLVEEALEAAVTQGDYSVMEKLLDVISDPFSFSPDQADYCKSPNPSSTPYQTYCGT